MRRTSPYYNLQFLVKCRPFDRHVFEEIAAFNSETIAIRYAEDCAKFHRNQPGWQYVVWARKGNKWVNITPASLKGPHDA